MLEPSKPTLGNSEGGQENKEMQQHPIIAKISAIKHQPAIVLAENLHLPITHPETKRKSLIQDMESMALQSPSKKRRPRRGGYKKNKSKKRIKTKKKSKSKKRTKKKKY